MSMLVIVAGGGRVGAQLASSLLEHGHSVRVIEARRDVLALLHRQLPTEVIFEGNVTDPELLERIGLGQRRCGRCLHC